MADTFEIAPADRATYVALFAPSADVLAERVRVVGMLSTEHGDASSVTIHAALMYGHDVQPVGLSTGSVGNALAAFRMAHDVLGADAPGAYADVLTAIHAVRVKPLREAWDARVKSIPATDPAARLAELLPAIADATNVAEKKKTDAAQKKKDDAEKTEREEKERAERDAALTDADRVRVVLADVLALIAAADDADVLALIAADVSAVAARAAERAAELTPALAPVPAPRKRSVKASA
jgi:hypothetical protein